MASGRKSHLRGQLMPRGILVWLIPIGLVTWAAGNVLWRFSLLLGLITTVLGGLALSWALTQMTRSASDYLRILGVAVPMTVALTFLSIGMSSNVFEIRVASVTLGLLSIIIVFIFVVSERTRAEVESERLANYEQQRQVAADIHDVVGHTLSASLLHTTAARLAIRGNPENAIASLEHAERHGRRSLDDIRNLVRVMRADDPLPTTPILGAEHISTLVTDLQKAGADITFIEPSDQPELPIASAITLYRVVQEGLTNAVRHGHGPIHLTLDYDDDCAVIDIVNPVGPSHSRLHEGSGLEGMRDRATSVGGSLQASLDLDGTMWELHARIPR
jgi:signal transduction histidine kinase